MSLWSSVTFVSFHVALALGLLSPVALAQEQETVVSEQETLVPAAETTAEVEEDVAQDAEGAAPEDFASDEDAVLEDSASEGEAEPPLSRSEALDLLPNPDPLFLPLMPEEVEITNRRSLTLEDAIAIAQENNKTVQIQGLQVIRQQSALRQQQAQLFPSLTFNSNLQQIGTDTTSDADRGDLQTGTTGDSNQTQTQGDGAIRLDYTILDFSRNATIKAAEKLVRQAELQLEQTVEELERDVAIDYYNLQEADEQVRIFQESVRAAERSLQDAEALEKAGVGTRFAVLQSEVQLSNERQNLVNAQSDQLQARRQLAQRLNLPQTAEIVAADPVEKAGEWDLSLPESIVLSYQGRPELQRRLIERDVNEFQRQAQLGAIKPTLSFFGQYSITGQLTDTEREQFSGVNDTSLRSYTNQYQLGLNLRWNFFDGGAAKAAARQEEVDIQISELQFEDDRNLIRQQVETAFYDVEANLKNIETAGRGVEQAREALRLARLRFQAGVGTQIDVINAERDLTQSEGNLATAVLSYNRALAQLIQAVSE